MGTIPLSIARYVREAPAKASPQTKSPQEAAGGRQATGAEQRLLGSYTRFTEYLQDPLVKESGGNNADGLLTSQGEARFRPDAGRDSGQDSASGRPSAQRAVLEANSVSLMAALGAESSDKSFAAPPPVVPAAPAAPQTAPEPAKGASAGYKNDPSVRAAAKELQRRMLLLDPNAEKRAQAILTRQARYAGTPSGKLSATFESGKEGIEAIGYDRTGGTSYGKYQIASRTGSLEEFLTYLKAQEPEWAARLQKAGPANTGSRKGKMPAVWKDIAQKHPKRFEQLQDAFILQHHYQPALQHILQTNKVDMDSLDPAVKEVLLSTSVQHGPSGAAEIFSKAMQHAGVRKGQNFDKELIQQIYQSRSSEFPSSTDAVQQAVRSRLMREQALALTLLGEKDIQNMF